MTNPLTPEELQAMRERLGKLQVQDWTAVSVPNAVSNREYVVAGEYADEPDLIVEVWGTENDEDYTAFIANARQDMPRLLDEVERLQRAYNELQRTHEEYVREYNIC